MAINPDAVGSDPVMVWINPDEDVSSIDAWLDLVGTRERVELHMSAAELLAEARAAGEA